MQENKTLNIILLVLKILIIVILAASLIYYSTVLIDAYIDSLSSEPSDSGINIEGYPLAFALVFIFAAMTNGVCMFLGAVGFVISLIYKRTQKRTGNILTFTALFATPIALQIFLLIVGIFSGVFY